MAPLSRRQALLGGVPVVALAIGGGCITQLDLPSTEEITLAFSNESSTDVAVQFSITAGGSVVSEGEVQVPQGGYESVATRIDATGRHELRIEGDGELQSSHPFKIDEYDLQHGSGLIVEIHDDGTEMMMEE
ncbi:hypothetical protein [Halorarum salinum]|uniref:Uncharacterized protein n=1 Tax=Halorarum salinum TaxID=2743089 RepID=A0A7D5LC01_9EURY|nr:hypothetical protein [Halobaculum salinum]QLG63173.1 hypothetical protein HUG12_16115 [Halobaculum salinum]